MSAAGAHRGVTPEQTLARVRPLLPRLGITRIAMLTGLDVVGIPVAAAYRPNSRSIAVHQGKGATLAAAKASAVMEALECWHAEMLEPVLRLATAGEIVRHGDALDPVRLPLTGQVDPGTARLLWTEAADLGTGRPVWVPFELVSADFTVPAPAGFGVFRQTTNGLACGNARIEAVLQGVYEVVERNAVARWHAATPDAQAARGVDPASADGAANRWLLARFAGAGVAIRIWDVTTDIELPAFLALACDADGVAGVEPEFGAGCHADADVALARALAEAAQARVTRISGARDDFPQHSFDPAMRADRHAAAQSLRRSAPTRPFRAVRSQGSAEADLDHALRLLAGAGCAQVACADLSRPEFGIPVVRIVVPGLEGAWEGAAA